MKYNNKLMYLLSFALMFSIGCEDDEAAAEAEAYDPAGEYVFPSRLVDGASSVSYTGQVVRNMLHSDLKSLTDLAASTTTGEHPYITYETMNSYFDHQDTDPPSYVSADACESVYTNIATGKNLSGKTGSGNLRGWSIDATTAVQAWMQAISDNYSQNGSSGGAGNITSPEGLNYSQMINKTLYGAVGLDQTFGYLSNYDESMPDNVAPKSDGSSYTVAEHKWDEAFGYFGARRDFLNPSDVGSCVDLTSEHNFGWAEYARKRDENPGYTFSFREDIFNHFVAGRAIIHNEGSVDDLAPHLATIRTRLEQLTAANVIHYVGSVKTAMESMTSSSVASSSESANYNKYWSEMRGFIIALQYTFSDDAGTVKEPGTHLTSAELDDIVSHVGIAPLYPGDSGYDGYADELDHVVDILETLF